MCKEEAKALLVCEWYVKFVEQNNSHMRIDGKLAYVLPQGWHAECTISCQNALLLRGKMLLAAS